MSATLMLVVAAFLVIDRSRLPLLCLGAMAAGSGSAARAIAALAGLPMVLAAIIAIALGAGAGWGLHLVSRYLKDVAFAATTLALACLSTLIPAGTGGIEIGLDRITVGAGVAGGAAALLVMRRFQLSILGAGLCFADHDPRLAAVLGIGFEICRGPILVMSGALAGLAGLLLHLCGAVADAEFGLELSLALLAVIVMAGTGRFRQALIASIPVLLMPRLGVWWIDGFPDLTLLVAALGVALIWLLESIDRRHLRAVTGFD